MERPTTPQRPLTRPNTNQDAGNGQRTPQRPTVQRPARPTTPTPAQERPAAPSREEQPAPRTPQGNPNPVPGTGRSNEHRTSEENKVRMDAIREKKRAVRPAVSDRWIDTHEKDDPRYGIGAEKRQQPKKKIQYHQSRLYLKPRDIEMIAVLARYRFGTSNQLERHFNVVSLRRRLAQLKKAGFLYNESITRTQSLWTPTIAGMDLVDLDYNVLSGGKINPSTIGHTLGLLNIGSDLETGKLDTTFLPEHLEQKEDGETVITEREISQSFNSTKQLIGPNVMRGTYEQEWGNEAWTYMLHGTGSKLGKTHKPDMVIDRGGVGQDIAIELELSPKRTNEWKNILLMYKASPYGHVIYYTHKRSIYNSLMKINHHEVGLENFEVRTYAATHTGIPFWG